MSDAPNWLRAKIEPGYEDSADGLRARAAEAEVEWQTQRLKLNGEIERLRGTLDDILALSSQGVTVEVGELTGSALLGRISALVDDALDEQRAL